MVSTRQMTITTAPGTVEESFDTTATGTSNITRQAASGSSSIQVRGMVTTTQTSLLETTVPKQSILLLDLPIELLDKIFSYVGYKNVAQLRLVSPKMNQICSSILNSTFQKLQTQTYNHFQNVKKTMPKRESARRVHPSASECDIVETCYMRLSLLEMTFGKHIDKKHCCFFPGAILDEVYFILFYIKTTPKLGRPYKITEELFDLSTMAMEYFKEKLEPGLPAIAYFSKDFLDFSCTKNILSSTRKSSHSSSMPSPPQSNMVLRKGIRKIKQGMKKYNNQLTVLRSDLRFCKRKSTEQTKQIAEMQKLLAEQQKQILEYAARLDENDKKNEEMSMKISTLLQEANKCKTELQYWRSKSPAISLNSFYGQNLNVSQQDVSVFLQQTVNGEMDKTIADIESDKQVQNNDLSIDLTTSLDSEIINGIGNVSNLVPVIEPSNGQEVTQCTQKLTDNLPNETSVISCVGSPKMSKRKFIEVEQLVSESSLLTNKATISAMSSGNDVKKARKVQNKTKFPPISTSCKTRSVQMKIQKTM